MAEQGDPFAQLREDMAAALATLESSLSSLPAVEHKVFVRPDDTLVFDRDNPNLDLELKRLRSIFKGISEMAGDLFAFVKSQGKLPETGHSEYAGMLRRAVSIRDCAAQMVEVLNGEDLSREITWLADGEHDRSVRLVDEVDESNHIKLDALASTFSEIPKDGQQIRSAFAYQTMKRVAGILEGRDVVVAGDVHFGQTKLELIDDLKQAMAVITGHKPVPTREET